MNVPMQNIPSTDNRLDRKIEIRLKGKTERFYYTVTDTKGRSNVGFVKPLCFEVNKVKITNTIGKYAKVIFCVIIKR